MGSQESDFGRWLDLTLSNRGIKSREFATQIGANETAVSKWRNGARKPPPEAIARMAQVLDVDRERLMVTAGLWDQADAPDMKPLPMPAPDAQRAALRRQLESTKGLTSEVIDKMMQAYDQAILRRKGDG